MSGICGILYFDSRQATQDILETMAHPIRHRGPDGIGFRCQSQVGFVNLTLFNTPESKFDSLPRSIKNDNYIIVYQGRLDNREELYQSLELKSSLNRTTDSELILGAYVKWNTNCSQMLLGDFSFAIWDKQQRLLYCARDHMGVMPFYYYSSNNFFAFSSEIKGLLALAEVQTTINNERIADYLTCVVTDSESTFYTNILRLPSGYQLTVKNNKTIIHNYGKLKPVIHNCKKDSDFQEQFRDLFTDAVRCRLRSLNPVGAYLSGGLDSSSIVCVISALLQSHLSSPLHSFSSVFDKIYECDEREYFSHVIKRYPHLSHPIAIDSIRPGPIFDKMTQREDEPFFAPHFISPWVLMEKAKSYNIGTLLDGHDGDSAVSYGSGFLNELLLSGRFFRLVKECGAIGKNPGIKSTIRTLLRISLMCSYDKLQFTGLHSPTQKFFLKADHLLNNSFAEETHIAERLFRENERYAHQGHNEQLIHMLSITHPRQQLVIELFERQVAYFQLNSAYPYFDKRIIEFCLGLPAEQKFGKGYNRRIVRDSLRDILPESIKQRKGKTYFNLSLINGFLNTDKTWFFLNLDTMYEGVYDYIDLRYFNEIYDKLKFEPDKTKLNELSFLLRCLSLSKWLVRN